MSKLNRRHLRKKGQAIAAEMLGEVSQAYVNTDPQKIYLVHEPLDKTFRYSFCQNIWEMMYVRYWNP